ncbi:carbohydrate kinase family protein [Noviherbaspirillum sedimenti]|uniref:Carbohydrate kinase n=1 Tax=Noviherbaspirillum sedimenti TaxID=2320865 RepID=A0A3A3GLG1_9BURK|nr:carbohydrate kinase [Noviherbaspirillum sedimenti]RJG01800.1 carbohydrate kinase [Noviherbaspirillum sedimenti]
MATIPFPRYVVFGEALTDMIRQDDGSWRAMPGGSCWNVARVGARLGVPTGFAGAVSMDMFGDDLERMGNEAGLDRRFLQRVDALPFLAMVTSKNPPSYFFIGENSADLQFDPALLPEGWLRAAEVIHVGSLSLARQPLAARLVEQAIAAHRAGKRIAFDPNMRQHMDTAQYQETFRLLASIASYIKVSDEDLEGLFPGLSPAQGLTALRQLAPGAEILLTRGAAGMSLLRGDSVWEQPAFRVEVADTVGCGDAAMAGWMSSLLLFPGSAPARHLQTIAAVAALAATRAGPYAPCRDEVALLLNQRKQGASASSIQVCQLASLANH